MNWKIRHEGSPRSIEGLTVANVVEGLQDGQWETTDEVMGPGDTDWVPIENHPQLEELAAEMEPPPPRHHPDETVLDMNPLIDVCLVLLIFFILTTSYAALQKVLDMPTAKADVDGQPLVMDQKKVEEFTLQVQARQENGRPVIRIEKTVVEPANLVSALKGLVKSTRKTNLLVDAAGVDWDTVVKIQDAAKGAGVNRIYYPVKPDEIPAKK
jgi:biopolymer transport protein ExbD